ncbi:MAG: DUF3782 domain-containing protein [Arenimonas sp.]
MRDRQSNTKQVADYRRAGRIFEASGPITAQTINKSLKDENQAQMREEFKRIYAQIMTHSDRYERGIGALGSRWAMQSEKPFRDALAGILEKNFGVQVVNVNEYDDHRVLFGRPDQIELDVIIHICLLLIRELNSSIDKAGMYIFGRKVRYYEQQHQRTANRLIVISPDCV